jgi:riboflavin kinase/FMN adenylyltransferase
MALVTIGKFDGVHVGHQRLVRTMADAAHARGLQACVVTFDRHPFAVLRPSDVPLQLASVRERVTRLRAAGANDVWVCTFTEAIARLDARGFMDLVQRRWKLDEVWVAEGFALGRGRTGTTEVLRTLGEEQGWDLRVMRPAEVAGDIVSSSRIRQLLEEGRGAEAQELLAQPLAVA